VNSFYRKVDSSAQQNVAHASRSMDPDMGAVTNEFYCINSLCEHETAMWRQRAKRFGVAYR
jgi:hypothetical protein